MKNRLITDLKESMKEGNKIRTNAIKAVRQAITSWEKENSSEINEEQTAKILDSLVNSRNKSIKEYENAGREDMANVEKDEIRYISTYLPERVSKEEILKTALEVKEDLGATTMKDMGRMMGNLKAKFGALAKASDISDVVKSILD